MRVNDKVGRGGSYMDDRMGGWDDHDYHYDHHNDHNDSDDHEHDHGNYPTIIMIMFIILGGVVLYSNYDDHDHDHDTITVFRRIIP